MIFWSKDRLHQHMIYIYIIYMTCDCHTHCCCDCHTSQNNPLPCMHPPPRPVPNSAGKLLQQVRPICIVVNQNCNFVK